MEKGHLYLCKPDYTILGIPSGIKPDTCTLTKKAFDFWELSVDVNKYVDAGGKLVQSDYYDSLSERMYLYLDTEKVYFLIDSEPAVSNDGSQETKTVTAHSNECELNYRYLSIFKINCGTFDSQEYLVDGNVNPYTNLPKNYISLVNYENHQLSLMHLALQNTDWKVKENLPAELCSIKKSFDVSNNSIYSFLMKTVSPSCKVFFEFDRKNKEIRIIAAEKYGIDSGVNICVRNLLQSFDVSSSLSNGIITKLIPKGADDKIGISYVNFGLDYILILDYFMNERNEYGDYKFVSKELHDKYNAWINYRDKDLITYEGKQYTRRELYTYLTKLYHKTILDINEIKNRVPNDGCNIDYTKYSYEELIIARKAYRNALDAIVTLYKNEYQVSTIGNYPDYTPVPSTATNIKDTIYWNDYFSFQEKILPAVEEALKAWCETDANGNLKTDANGDFIYLEYGNPAYYSDNNIVKPVDAWLYEFSLFGLDELKSKKKAWGECANLLFHECFIVSGTASNPTAYRTPDEKGWNTLTDEQKREFTTFAAYCSTLNSYLDYMSLDTRENSLVTYYKDGIITKRKCKGIIRQCDDAISERLLQISNTEKLQSKYNDERNNLANSVTINGCVINGSPLFSEKDKQIINNFIKEEDYSNSNIITTNLDDIVSLVDIQKELYDAAYEELYVKSRPQYSFSSEIDNLFSIEEFKCMEDTFCIGNYVWLYTGLHEDNNKEKLRLISMTYNPVSIDDNLSVEFSTMSKSLYGILDINFLFDELLGGDSGSNSSSGSSSGNSNGGIYGENDAEIQLSNNVLNAILNTELFATSVNDVLLDSIKGNKANFNTLFSHSGIFDSLEAGRIKISGDCIFDYIKSSNYVNGKSGSMLNTKDGTFSFAGGALRWDGKELTIGGYASSDDLNGVSDDVTELSVRVDTNENALKGLGTGVTKIHGGCLSTQNIISDNYNGNAADWLANTKGSILRLANGTFNFGGGKLKYDGKKLSIDGEGKFTGAITATSGSFTGTVNATDGSFTGDVTANTLTADKKGTIAGWTFDNNGFYKNNSGIAYQNSMYLGKDGISLNDYFVVSQDGIYFKSKGFTSTQYSKEIYYYSPYINKSDSMFGETYKNVRIYLYNVGNIENYNLSFEYHYYWYNDAMAVQYTQNLYRIRGWGANGRTEMLKSIVENDGEDVRIMELPISDIFHESGNQENKYLEYVRAYSYGRTIDGKWFDAVQIGKIEFCDENWAVLETINGTLISSRSGLMFNTYTQNFFSDNFHLGNDYFSHKDIYNNTTSGSANVYVNNTGRLSRSASSSKRYKTDITTVLPDTLSPEKIYDLNIYSYKYKENYLSVADQRYGQDFIGFIAEDVYEKYPIACNLDNNGNPEMWNINILFPALAKLVQDQHKDIEGLKQKFKEFKEKIDNDKTDR